MHGWDLFHAAAIQTGNSLMAKTHPEDRHIGMQNRIARYSEIPLAIGAPRPRRDDDVIELQLPDLLPARLIVSHDNGILARDLCDQMGEVEGERIVVVDYERGHYTPDTRRKQRVL